MAERFNQQTNAQLNSFSEANFPAVFDRISRLEASNNINSNDDDLIASLQNCRENARARQVFEWELARRQTPPQNYQFGAI